MKRETFHDSEFEWAETVILRVESSLGYLLTPGMMKVFLRDKTDLSLEKIESIVGIINWLRANDKTISKENKG